MSPRWIWGVSQSDDIVPKVKKQKHLSCAHMCYFCRLLQTIFKVTGLSLAPKPKSCFPSPTCALRPCSFEEDTRKSRTKGCDFTTCFVSHDPMAGLEPRPLPFCLRGAELQLDRAAGYKFDSEFHPRRIYVGKFIVKNTPCLLGLVSAVGGGRLMARSVLANITHAALIRLFAVARRSNESVSRQRV